MADGPAGQPPPPPREEPSAGPSKESDPAGGRLHPTGAQGPAVPAVPLGGVEAVLKRLRSKGHDPAAFAGPRTRRWFFFGLVALATVAVLPLPFLFPEYAGVTQRLATLLSLVFLMGAIGLWLGMGGRSFVVSSVFVLLLYALTAWTRFAFPLQDFFVVAVLVSFAIFALAGFNLVFVLEEVVYDAHVRIHLRSPLWNAAPSLAFLTLAITLPAWESAGGPTLGALWIGSVAVSALLGGWWFLRAFNDIEEGPVLRELHLFAFSTLAVTGLADAASTLRELPSLAPSLIAYLALIATWFYASYTTLQRTHFLMSGKNAAPWVSILVGASYAILAHAQVLFQAGGTQAVADLADQRIDYLMAGIWIGIAFYVARGLWRIFRHMQATRGLGVRGARVAGGAARVAGSLAGTERYLQDAAEAVFRGIDHVLPGEHREPHRQVSWELEPDATLRPVEPNKPR